MDRRDFIRLAGAGVAAGTTQASMAARQSAAGAEHRGRRRGPLRRMKVGTQHDSSDEVLGVLAALGVRHICSRLPSVRLDEQWSADGLQRLRERVEAFGITLDMVPLPMSSNPIARAENPNILLGKSPERDREIDDICQMIRNAAKAGIPVAEVQPDASRCRPHRPTRPAAAARRYSTFVYDEAPQDPPLTEAGPGECDVYWERITYFLERVIPVATDTRSAWRAIHRIPACRPARATAASKPFSVRSQG